MKSSSNLNRQLIPPLVRDNFNNNQLSTVDYCQRYPLPRHLRKQSTVEVVDNLNNPTNCSINVDGEIIKSVCERKLEDCCYAPSQCFDSKDCYTTNRYSKIQAKQIPK
mmetsp:Transcript_7387/g.11267  ORF Transcript_7387/g.11267 Transcript_7387/m.11267 type:complete len:108 (-) Transcript_7387:462-785(-)